MNPHKCPVCGGRGIVDGGFYNGPGPMSTANATTETCRSCQGTGIVWEQSVAILPGHDYSKIPLAEVTITTYPPRIQDKSDELVFYGGLD